MSAKNIIRAIEIVLVLSSFGFGAVMAHSILGTRDNAVAQTQLSSKFLEEGLKVAGSKALRHSANKPAAVEKRQAIPTAGAAR